MADAGRPVPALDQRPSIDGEEWLWDAFAALTTCRQIGMSPGPIPWTATEQWARAHTLDLDDRFLLHRVIPEMDAVLFKHFEQQAKAQKPAKPQKRR